STVRQPSTSAFLDDLAAGEQGKVDVALVDRDTLTYLIGQGLVEPIDRTLVPNLRLVSAPFSNPPYDPGSAHNVLKDYRVVGYAVFSDGLLDPVDTWQGLFVLATALLVRGA